MKIILIRPPNTSFGEFKKIGGMQHPINLVYLSTYLSHADVEVEIMDLEVESQDELLNLKRKNPDVVGITAVTPNMPSAAEIAEKAKDSGAKVILGGVHPTVMPEKSLCETSADIVIRGEGEITLKHVVERLRDNSDLRGVEGISYKTEEGIFHNKPRAYVENLDTLPIPDRTLLKLGNYHGETSPGIPKKSTVMFTSRGCPFNCFFCSAHLIHGKNNRMRSIENLMKEVASIDELGFEHISIHDDTFTLSKKRVIQFCDAMRKYPHITFDCLTRVDAIDEEMLAAMKNAGCIKIAYGVESGSPKVLKDMKKGITIDQILSAFRKTKKVGIKTEAFVMVGHLVETKKDFEMTIRLIKKIDPHMTAVSIVTPYPGIGLFDLYTRRGYLKEDTDWSDFIPFSKEIPWRTDYFTGEEIVKMRDQLLKKIYLSPVYIAKRIMDIRSFDDFKYCLKSGLAMLKFIKRRASSSARDDR